jgi:hypothetical protein
MDIEPILDNNLIKFNRYNRIILNNIYCYNATYSFLCLAHGYIENPRNLFHVILSTLFSSVLSLSYHLCEVVK